MSTDEALTAAERMLLRLARSMRGHDRSPMRIRPVSIPLVVIAVLAGLALACSRPGDSPDLAPLCAGHEVTQRVDATVDTVLPHGGTGLLAARGRHFALRFTFRPAPATGPAAGLGGANGCDGQMGSATFKGDVPQPLRTATSASNEATWRIEGDTVILDLNPKTRDNNLMLVLPLAGGRGHWGLSTFAGEVARGTTGPR